MLFNAHFLIMVGSTGKSLYAQIDCRKRDSSNELNKSLGTFLSNVIVFLSALYLCACNNFLVKSLDILCGTFLQIWTTVVMATAAKKAPRLFYNSRHWLIAIYWNNERKLAVKRAPEPLISEYLLRDEIIV